MSPISIIFNILIFCHNVLALNILGIVSVPLKSHYMAMQKLFPELAARGHSVTVINNFPTPRNVKNLRFINLNRDLNLTFTTLEMFENMNPSLLHWKNFHRFLTYTSNLVQSDCECLFTNEDVKRHLAERNKYDVVFVEMFTSDCALVYAATNFDAPIIGITSHVLLPTTYSPLGIPFDIASDSYFFTKGGPNPSLLTKVEVVIMKLCYYIQERFYFHPILQQHVQNTSIDVERVAKDRMKMVFAYQHYSMTGARLLAPQLLEISGLHISKPKPVPQDVEDFLSKAEHGTIYVSLGTNLNSSLMSPRRLKNFLATFKKIPQKVPFKWENNTFPEGNDNVLTRKWFPQLDVLCHPKLIGFVSHSGMLSSTEAVYCGKPMVTMPFFGDQFDNSGSLEATDFAKTLYLANVTPENLANAITEITSPQMQRNAQKVSQLWHDRPLPVMDSAIYWTEYVARYRTAPPSLPSKHSTWFESLLLDVISVFVLIAFVLVWLSLDAAERTKSISALARPTFTGNG
uniref:UDP-glucuronosyltransferase n=1 Tax=Chilo suppressalis TaxID=168631 RepID=A0A481XWB2_CHISP|nr:UDP-glycosyltransferase UGT45C1 [Chilo suppressalis]